MNFSIQISKGAPSNAEEWERLAKLNSNLYQSTYYDNLQSFFAQQPVYFEAYNNNGILSGGVKIYYWESRKLGIITSTLSKSVSQIGELITVYGIGSDEFAEMKKQLIDNVKLFLNKNKIVKLTIYGMYGNEALLMEMDRNPVSGFLFNAGYVDIDKPEDDIFAGFNRNTHRNLKKAESAGLDFFEENDIEKFLPVMDVVYSQQQPPTHPPNSNYLRHIYKTLYAVGMVDVHLVKQRDDLLSAAYFFKYGENVYSAFGGSVKNELGAGQFIYWQLMKKYRLQGYKKFYFGQVASSVDEKNTKFSVGITNFKRGFGLVELESYKKNYVLSNSKNKLWELLLKSYKR